MAFVELKRIKKRFSDINLSFAKHPVTDDIAKRLNEKAIIESLKNLVLTKMYGRPFHPELSCDIFSLQFENLSHAVLSTMNDVVITTINNFEPRVQLQLVECKPTDNETAIQITIIFKIVGTTENIKTQFFLQRTI